MILEQERFHKISVTELENLVFCYFCKIINIKAENEFLKDYYISNVDSFKDYQVVTNDLIDELLYSDEYIHDRIENINIKINSERIGYLFFNLKKATKYLSALKNL